MLRRARDERHHRADDQRLVLDDLRPAPARIGHVEDDVGISAALAVSSRHPARQLAHVQHLDELGDGVARAHVLGVGIVERAKDVGLVALGEGGDKVHLRRHDDEPGREGEFLCCLAELGEHQEGEEEGGDDVGRDGAFVVLGARVFVRGDAGALDEGVDAWQGLRAAGECLDGFVRREVEGPDFEDAFFAGLGFDGLFGGLAFGYGADGEDHFGGVESD